MEKTWKSWTLAAAIWMVDGQVLLGDQSAVYRMYELMQSVPRHVRDDLFSVFTGLMNRVDISLERLEAFMYESESRYLWKSEGRRIFDATVIPGMTSLGMNPVQKVWTYFNDIEDAQEHRKHEWAIAKFNMSAHAPKGIKKLNDSDQKHEQTEKVRRQRVMDTMFYKASGAIQDSEDPKKSLVGPIHSLQTVNTVEEMEEEMRKWVAGDHDFHDKVVLATKARIRQKRQEEEEAQLRRIREVREAMDQEGIDEPAFSPLMGEHREKALARLSRRKVATVYDNSSHNSAYEKYIKNNPEVGALSVEGDRLVVNSESQIPHEEILAAMSRPEDPATATPQSLTDKVRARGKPTIRGEE
jgi:hypothetical protein